ncbi:hypothetical protein CVT25_002836 [Psilocybe cyanescens]|uniref:Uncharacterized protein n=1 Tax=Psilocybe cyanescens TaxID=93625 RepID=A0A409XR52_PSICY|nr:hypothetical protein CVT25_002836 [Psilocybe cyanescens]
MPMEANQFLHASAPVRALLATLAGVKWLATRNAGACAAGTALLGVVLYDGLGGLVLGGIWGRSAERSRRVVR